MRKYLGYRIAILILSIVIVIQGIFIIIMRRPKRMPPLPLAIKGKIAIVIDDWGYNLNNIPVLDQIRYPLTMSVLPNLNYSHTVSEILHKGGFEIILHLPMEPYEKFRLEKNTIMTYMDEKTIKNIIRQDLVDISGVRGLSNHMGSRATEDLRTMEIIFRELKTRNLYFLDSFVSPKSICLSLARKMNLAFAKRDVFLDNIEKAEYIKGQIYKLKNKARFYREAIGIGHDRKITLEVLKEELPKLEKEGYKLVFLSELVK